MTIKQNDIQALLHIAKTIVYDKCGLAFDQLLTDKESQEYGACRFKLNGMHIKFRVSKITPTKPGQFVTIWKRNHQGITQPFDITDNIDFIIIAAQNGENSGQFIFPKDVLAQQGIISGNGKPGKRGIRVYPPWDTPANKQATKTQSWQTKYFLTISKNTPTDFSLIKELFFKPIKPN